MDLQKDIKSLLAPLSYLQEAGEGGENGDVSAKESFLKTMRTLCDLLTETKFMQFLEGSAEVGDEDKRLEAAEAAYKSALGELRIADPGLVAEEVRLAREIAQVQEQIRAEQRLADISEEEATRLGQRVAELSAPKQSITEAVGTTQDLTVDDLQAERDLKALRDVRNVVETVLGVSVQSVDDGAFTLGIGRYAVAVMYERETSRVINLQITPKPPQNVTTQAEATLYLNNVPTFVLYMKEHSN